MTDSGDLVGNETRRALLAQKAPPGGGQGGRESVFSRCDTRDFRDSLPGTIFLMAPSGQEVLNISAADFIRASHQE